VLKGKILVLLVILKYLHCYTNGSHALIYVSFNYVKSTCDAGKDFYY